MLGKNNLDDHLFPHDNEEDEEDDPHKINGERVKIQE